MSKAAILNVGVNYHIKGGSDRYLFSLESLLRQHGHDVIPFATAAPQNLETKWSRFFPLPIDMANPSLMDLLRFIYSARARRSMKKILPESRPDVAHLHIYYGQLTASILSPLREMGVPIVQTLHEYKIVCPTYSLYDGKNICQACNGTHYWKAAIKRCNRNSFARSALVATESYVSRWLGSITDISQFIAVSDFLRDKVVELGVPSSKVTTVHNFIDCEGVDVATKPGEYLLYFGRLEETKGLMTLLDAIEPLRDIPLIIVGEGSLRARLTATIQARGMHHVQLLGFKTGAELEGLIRGCVCSITPSIWYETFGLTLLETFKYGRPVIASRLGGMTEVVENGRDGLLFESGNHRQLREHMLWMWNNRQQVVEMGSEGRTKAELKFGAENHYEKIKAVYRKSGVALSRL